MHKTKQAWRRCQFVRFLSAGLLFCSAVTVPGHVLAAEGVITFTTAPTQSPAKTRELYGPLVEYISQASGEKIELVPARNFLEYTSKMRKGEYDIIFDGPHFVAWRIERINHTPLARLPGELVFIAAVRDGDVITARNQLVGKKVCAVNSPNLATLMMLDAFPNPVQQPVIVSQRSFKDAMSCLKDGKGVAAFLPINFWKKFDKAGKTKGFRILYSSKKEPLPTRTFSVSERVDAAMREKIRNALVNSEGQPGALPVLNRFRSKNFVPASKREYRGLSRLLASVWGFHE